MSFKSDFIWGTAAASYQIEGAWDKEGKGLSVWDVFCTMQGKVWRNQSGKIACDHFNRYETDIELMAEIGVKAYRLSLSWPRILPEGKGEVNEKGLQFYDRLIDLLLEKEIDPWVTLFHWDYPYELFLKGGWLSPKSPKWFADYVKIVVDRLSDRVSHWITLNEPQAYIGLGHQQGIHAPGLKLGLSEVLQAGHNTLLAHGKAVKTIRDYAVTKPRIGAAQSNYISIPLEETDKNIKSAIAHNFSIREKNMWNNTWFSDPMILGRYPEDGIRLFGSDLHDFPASDMEIIAQKLDFIATNNYHGIHVDHNGLIRHQTGGPMTTMGWDIIPETLYWGPRFLHERYRLPVVVTENGMANCDWIQDDGNVHDPQRIDYLLKHLRALKRASQDGIPIDGYFQWSILDNFEWSEGYKQRFGLIFVDYKTQERVLKDSAYWYQNVIKSNGNEI